jgi:hypothetical protein
MKGMKARHGVSMLLCNLKMSGLMDAFQSTMFCGQDLMKPNYDCLSNASVTKTSKDQGEANLLS